MTNFPLVPDFTYPSNALPVFSVDDFTQAMLNLTPQGRVWAKQPQSNLYMMLRALVGSFYRMNISANNLLLDIFPPTTIDLLKEWQETCGLPDPCADQQQTFIEQRDQVVSRIIDTGGQSIPYLIAFAANLGFTITITEGLGMTQTNISETNYSYINEDFFNWYIHSSLFTETIAQTNLSITNLDYINFFQGNAVL